jgi:hypothetical protein
LLSISNFFMVEVDRLARIDHGITQHLKLLRCQMNRAPAFGGRRVKPGSRRTEQGGACTRRAHAESLNG